ncbi:MAG: hypothetical protein VCA36_10370 [Opitutales bacterium]
MANKAPSSEARAAAQRRFLEIAHELEPKLARSLYDDVLPKYPNHLEALRAWLGKWNLFEDWQLEHATNSIGIWNLRHRDYDPHAGWPVFSTSYSPALQPLTPLDVACVAWDRGTPLDEAEDEALAAWSDYRKLITGYYKALRGSQRARKDPDSDRHMRWLVRRQILGDSDKDITETDSSDGRGGWALAVKTVTDGIKKAEALVGPFRSEQPRLEVWHDDPDDIHYVE